MSPPVLPPSESPDQLPDQRSSEQAVKDIYETLVPPGEPSLKAKLWQHAWYHRLALRGTKPLTITGAPVDPWPGDIQAGLALRRGQQSLDATFRGLRDLHAIGGPEARQLGIETIKIWLDKKNSARHWEADTTAIRVVHWLRHFSFVGYGAAPAVQDRMRAAIHRQLRWLEHSYSLHTPPTRLLILIALLHATCSTEEYTDSREEYINVLGLELSNFIQDGQHPSLQLQEQVRLLRRLVSVRTLLNHRGLKIPLYLQRHIMQAAAVLQLLQLGDGSLPKLRNEPGPSLRPILALAGNQLTGNKTDHKSITSNTANAFFNNEQLDAPLGFARLCKGSHLALVDLVHGPQALAFEYSAGRLPIITSCGRPTKMDAAWAEALRAAAAASTADLRGNASISIEEYSDTVLIGTATKDTVTHQRYLNLLPKRGGLEGTDTITNREKSCLRFHLHPAINVNTGNEATERLYLTLPGGAIWVFYTTEQPDTACTLTVEPSIHFDAKGEQHTNQQIVIALEGGASKPLVCNWLLKPA